MEELIKELEELAKDLSTPTFTARIVPDQYLLSPERIGWNNGQRKAGKRLDAIIRRIKETDNQSIAVEAKREN